MDVLRIENLTKAFAAPDGARVSVVDVPEFTLAAAEQMALRGQSGTGKTTFLNLIAGILQADGGAITINGTEITQLSESERDAFRALNMGYVFQTFNLLQGFTALENVLLGMSFGPGADKAQATALLERVGLKERLHYRPRQLSVGQQQRVAIARALATKPKLVLADEPTGNLDPRNAAEALKLLRETCKEQNAALLLVSHDREVLAGFERTDELGKLNRAAASTVAPAPASAEGASA